MIIIKIVPCFFLEAFYLLQKKEKEKEKVIQELKHTFTESYLFSFLCLDLSVIRPQRQRLLTLNTEEKELG